MLRVCKSAALGMIFIGILRWLLVYYLEGDSVLDVTTVGSIALGVVAYIITFIAPTPEQLQQMREQGIAKREAAKKAKKD